MLISRVAWCGQARIRRRFFLLLGWALARSPGRVGGVDGFLVRRQPQALVEVVVACSAALRDFGIPPGAAMGAVGDDSDLGGSEGVDQFVLAGRAHDERFPYRRPRPACSPREEDTGIPGG